MKTLISVEGVSVSYRSTEAINNITLDIRKGEFVCIIGPNGGGKTTLLNTVLGFLKPDCGSVNKAYSAISYVPQIAEVDRRFPISVTETVMTAFLKSGLHPFRFFKKAEKEKAQELLRLVGLEDKAKMLVSELSGGEFQRMLIARALAAEPEIILLDEPTANVDPASRDKIFGILKDLNQKGITVVTVTHDLAAAVKTATKLVCVKRELVYCGEPKITEAISQAMYGAGIDFSGGIQNA